ncbi:MAG: metal ABC transporter substrate-binding protein [Polyangiaceae bacterium]
MMRRWGLLMLLWSVALLLAGCDGCSGGGGKAGGASGKPVVMSSIFPVYDLVRRVGGEAIQAEVLLTPGQSAHDFQPSPKLAKTVATAKLAFTIGVSLDGWATKTVEAAGSGVPIVVLSDTVKPRTFETNRVGGHAEEHDEGHDGHGHDDHGHGHDDHGHDHGGADPHLWLSVPNALAMVDVIERELVRVLPEHEATFTANAAALRKELTALHESIKTSVGSFREKTLVTFHGSFGYFAAEYGLSIAAVIEPFPGKQPSAAYLKEVLHAIEGKPVAALFTEPQLDARPAEVLAKEAKLPLGQLDPLGGGEGRDSYDALMRFNLKQLEEKMK